MKRDIQPAQKAGKIPLPPGINESDLKEPERFYGTPEYERWQKKLDAAAKENKKKGGNGVPQNVMDEYYKVQDAHNNRPDVKVVDQFEALYTTSLGWCIPTLMIRAAGARQRERAYQTGTSGSATDRTYATTLDGKPCRVGMGPHVLRKIHVFVTETRRPDLEKYLDLRQSGEVTANEIRDRISSRRAQGSQRRGRYPMW